MANLKWSFLGEQYSYELTSPQAIPALQKCFNQMMAYQKQNIDTRYKRKEKKILQEQKRKKRCCDYRLNAWINFTDKSELAIMQKDIKVTYINEDKIIESWIISTSEHFETVKNFVTKESILLKKKGSKKD